MSVTTRERRPGEIHGTDYFFINKSKFKRLVERGCFLEWAEFAHENFYGTLWDPVISRLAAGTTVFLELEVQGAKQVKEKTPEAITIFIAPPDPAIETLRQRILLRGDVSAESMERRLRTAREELAQEEFFDHHVVNDELELAKNEMLWCVRGII